MGKLLQAFDKKIFFWILLGLMVFIPLYPKFPLVSIPKTYVAVRLEDVLIAIVFTIWFLCKLPKFKRFLFQPIYKSFYLYWAIGLLSLVSAIFLTSSVLPHLGVLHWLRRIEYMTLFIMAATTISSISQVKTILKVGLVITLVIALYGFGQQWLNFPVISTTNREFSKGLILYLTPDARVNSTFAGHYDLAAYLSIVLVLMGSLFFVAKRLWVKSFIALTGLLSFFLLGLTAARVSFVATLLGLTISFWLNGKKLFIGLLILASVATLIAVPDLRHRLLATITVNFLGGGGPKYELKVQDAKQIESKLSEASRAAILREATLSGYKISTVSSDIAPGEPVNSTELGVYRSFGIRMDVEWPRALRAFYKNPILGTGFSSITIATDNDYLRSLGEVGLLGTLAFGLILIIIFVQMVKFIRKNHGFDKAFMVGMLCVLIAMMVTATFIDVLEASKIATILWFLLGVAWAVSRDYEDAK